MILIAISWNIYEVEKAILSTFKLNNGTNPVQSQYTNYCVTLSCLSSIILYGQKKSFCHFISSRSFTLIHALMGSMSEPTDTIWYFVLLPLCRLHVITMIAIMTMFIAINTRIPMSFTVRVISHIPLIGWASMGDPVVEAVYCYIDIRRCIYTPCKPVNTYSYIYMYSVHRFALKHTSCIIQVYRIS